MNKIPETIEELKMAYIDKNLPSEEITRFFIGKDYKHPRAFGIYKDEITGNFVVYKNKADGTRAVRYEGPDEAVAVKEIYIRLCDEIINQKSSIQNTRHRASREAKATADGIIIYVVVISMLLFTLIPRIFSFFLPRRGYYLYNNDYYYYQNGDWYEYGDFGWGREYDIPEALEENYSDYFESPSYHSYYDASDFRYTSYYEEPTISSSSDDSSSSYDSGSSWDSSDSWDSSSTDWDSDW